MRELNTVSQFPDLSWRWYNDIPILKGIYLFKTEYEGEPFHDSFNLEFHFPQNYPEKLPIVKELDNKIPATFHRNPDKSLCLCTPIEQYLVFSKKPTLENFIYNLLNPYILSWLWYQRFYKMPWGERSHGSTGIVESYQELLNLRGLKHAKQFMAEYIYNKIHQKQDCPCGSGLPFKRCHRNIIVKLENWLPKGQLIHDFIYILGG